MSKPLPKPSDLRTCSVFDCDYTGRVDSFPVSRTWSGKTIYRTICRKCYNERRKDYYRRRKNEPSHQEIMTRPPEKNMHHGRRKAAVEMVKFLTQNIDHPTPQEKMKVADIILWHYRELSRGEANQLVTRVLRANGRI